MHTTKFFAAAMITAAMLLPEKAGAQLPEKMSYQAVIRDNENNLITEVMVAMKISILQDFANGAAVYVETHKSTSNANGLVTIKIGTGTTEYDFSRVDWAAGKHFIKTEIDPQGGAIYSITGTSQLLSVPYAFIADSCINCSADTGIDSQWIETSDQWARYIYYSGGDISIQNDGDYTRARIYTNSDDPIECCVVSGHKSRGTYDIPTDVRPHDRIFTFTGMPFADGMYRSSAAMEIYAGDNIGAGSYPAYIIFGTTPEYGSSRIERMRINPEGFVGINSANPEAPLHVNDFMKLEPRNSAPSSPTKGMIYYDSLVDKVKVYTGTAWEDLN